MKNVRAIRLQRGLTQADLAAMAGVNQATISKLERGSEHVTLGLITVVAQALDVPPALLFDMPDVYQRAMNALSQAEEDTRELAVTVIEKMTQG